MELKGTWAPARECMVLRLWTRSLHGLIGGAVGLPVRRGGTANLLEPLGERPPLGDLRQSKASFQAASIRFAGVQLSRGFTPAFFRQICCLISLGLGLRIRACPSRSLGSPRARFCRYTALA